jgi:hypothetical protein
VIEYLWKAAWSFHTEGNPAAETWVHRHAHAILAGNATKVAGTIRRAATTQRLDPAKRTNADTCATYLTNKAPFLDYPTALTGGWPIATGVIEGTCRHLVKDRMDITGARWGLAASRSDPQTPRRSSQTTTSTPTGPTTSRENTNASTPHATPTATSRAPHDSPSTRAAPFFVWYA